MTRTITRLLLIFVPTAAYLGLAVWGEGGFGAFGSHPALVALVLVTVALILAAIFAGGDMSAGVREDRGNRWVLAVFGVLGLLDGWLPAWTDRMGYWTLDGDAVRWLGVVLFAAGGALRLWPVFVLGRRFSGLVAIQRDHTLKTNGIYGVVRHPSYAGLLVMMLGWGLAFRAGAGVLITLAVLWPLVGRMRAEERLLRSQFGDEYATYCARTARLVPGIY